jgi:hypothetical protein
MPRLATVEELMAYLDLTAEKVDGGLLETVLEGAEAFAEAYAGRRFSPDPALVSGADSAPAVAKTFTMPWTTESLRIPDLRVATLVTSDGGALTEGYGYEIDSTDAEPATRMRLIASSYSAFQIKSFRTVVITGRWGFNPTPSDVKDAVLTLAARRWRERDAAYADRITFAEGGSLDYLRQLPASVSAILNLYRPPRVGLVSA